jgi:hypothetical protein
MISPKKGGLFFYKQKSCHMEMFFKINGMLWGDGVGVKISDWYLFGSPSNFPQIRNASISNSTHFLMCHL